MRCFSRKTSAGLLGIFRIMVSTDFALLRHGAGHIWSGVWRSQPPPPPMVWSGTGWGGGGPGVCREGWGPLELQLEKRPGVTDQASKVRKPYASHKSYNVAQ